jgi:putative membrane protein
LVSTWDWLSAWSFEPSVVLGLIGLYGAYYLAVGPLRGRFTRSARISRAQLTSFTSGIFILFLALVSPLDKLSDQYWFSAHMAQHLLLTLAAPPLLLLGAPAWLFEPLRRSRALLSLARGLTNPLLAFAAFNFVFSIWHVPSLYNAALYSEPLHIFEHLTMIATAVWTWMPVLSPTPLLPRASPPLQVLYMFFQSIVPTGLGALITFASEPLYTFYASAPRVAGVSLMDDQIYAGLIMWIGGALAFLLSLTIIFFKWFGREEPAPGQGMI